MRIAVVTTSFPTDAQDPSGHFVLAEAAELARAGHDVHVYAPGAGQARFGRVHVHWIAGGDAFGFPGAVPRIRQRPRRVFDALRFVITCRRQLRRQHFDRIVAHFVLPSAWPILSGSSTPIEVVGHGTDVRLLMALPTPVGRAIVRGLLRNGATFRFVSTEQRRGVARFIPELASAEVRPAALDLSGVPGRAAARHALGLRQSTDLAVVVGRLIASKRSDVALSAALLMPNTDVVVVGDGPLREPLQSAFPGARFLGQLPRDVCLTWIAAADVLITASRYEGAPTVVREARSLGIPVVSVPVADVSAWAERDPELFVVSGHDRKPPTTD
jgi:glycosyltransferase involved in cell wall biosynthesis